MDGNGRWAQARGLPRIYGHQEGKKNVKRIVRHAANLGIKYLSLFAFSTENWKRPKEEVDGLMEILKVGLQEERPEFIREGIRVVFFGDRTKLPKDVIEEMELTESSTASNSRLHLAFAINYSGRDDILRAIKRISQKVADGKINIDDINNDLISKELDTKDFPDPDLIIRTSGELRISNFYLWQSAYSEFYFTPVLWPDFDEKALESAIEAYQSRKRRFGGI
ncbi:isoprenyl transferase [bacterium]|nr:isoprenyl transferase [bacterium]